MDLKEIEELESAGPGIDNNGYANLFIKDLSQGEELLRLAKLGVWAEKYGIAAVKEGLENTRSDFCSHGYKDGVRNKTCSWCEPFEKALAELPGTDLAPPK